MSDTLPRVYLSLASNIEPEKNLQLAVNMLRERCNVLAISSVYKSPPFGYIEQPDFLDIAVKCSTPWLPPVFKKAIDKIERVLGRNRETQNNKYGPLTIDIDILLWGDSAFSFGTKPWRVPDSSIVQEASIALPLAEIAPDYVHPEEGVTLAEIAARFAGTSVQKLPLKIE